MRKAVIITIIALILAVVLITLKSGKKEKPCETAPQTDEKQEIDTVKTASDSMEQTQLNAVSTVEPVAPQTTKPTVNRQPKANGHHSPKSETPTVVEKTAQADTPKEVVAKFTKEDSDELDKILENASRINKITTARANTIPDLDDQIETEDEKSVVREWQKTTIEKTEQKKSTNWAGFHKSPESKIIGLWQMGDSGAIAFYKDGTGQVSFVRDDQREQTLTGNFFFRYSIDGNLVQLIPILTKESKRKITANYIVKLSDKILQVGPYQYKKP